ncbi:MAG: hypothetical protein IKG40_00060 [Bacilli bacterium]|nr:hypothetical protein [Bacilli bacterium]
MNILFEISDKDIMFIGLFGVGIILFGVIIFYVLSKSEKKEDDFPEEEFLEEENPKQEYFEEIKPTTKEQQEAKDELEKVFKQMSEDLEEKEVPKKAVREFEREQEENAIISYQELIKQAEAKRNNPLADLKELEEINTKQPKINEEPKTFKNSEIISPIFGTQKPEEYMEEKRKREKNLYENTTNLEFLKNLKDFRDNL